MPLLTRFYEAKDDALEAVSELKQRGLRDSAARIIDNTRPAAESDLLKEGVQRKNAADYAVRIKNGTTLLIVEAPYAGTVTAEEILDRPRPNDKAKVVSHYEGGAWDEAAPVSSTLGLPTLLDNPAPLSSAFGFPVLAREKPSPSYGKPLVSDNFFPTAALGPLLTKDGKPFGFGFPLLANDDKPYSFGLPLLIKSKPIGFGLPLLAESEPLHRK